MKPRTVMGQRLAASTIWVALAVIVGCEPRYPDRIEVDGVTLNKVISQAPLGIRLHMYALPGKHPYDSHLTLGLMQMGPDLDRTERTIQRALERNAKKIIVIQVLEDTNEVRRKCKVYRDEINHLASAYELIKKTKHRTYGVQLVRELKTEPSEEEATALCLNSDATFEQVDDIYDDVF